MSLTKVCIRILNNVWIYQQTNNYVWCYWIVLLQIESGIQKYSKYRTAVKEQKNSLVKLANVGMSVCPLPGSNIRGHQGWKALRIKTSVSLGRPPALPFWHAGFLVSGAGQRGGERERHANQHRPQKEAWPPPGPPNHGNYILCRGISTIDFIYAVDC
jgi:hypothetical protein